MHVHHPRLPPRTRTLRGAALPGAIAATLALLAATSALAQDGLSADELAGAVSDKTYQGSMTADAFAEYYAADGTLRGDGYTGTWRAQDDALCFAYPEVEEQCWNVVLNGPAMTLIKDGEVDGSGMLVDGNPLGF